MEPRRTIVVADNLPGHVFQADLAGGDESATCSKCGLALLEFQGNPYPQYDPTRLEHFRNLRTEWQGSTCSKFPRRNSTVHPATKTSKLVVYNRDLTRPLHYFDSEQEAKIFLNSYCRAGFQLSQGAQCNHKIIREGDLRVPAVLLIDGIKYRDDGWQSPIPIVAISGARRSRPFRSLADSINSSRDLAKISQKRHVSWQIKDALNGRMEPIRCYLGLDWPIREIMAEAESLPGHFVDDSELPQMYGLFTIAACEIETILRRRFPELTAADAANFWTSLQVFRHFEGFAVEKLADRTSPQNLDRARIFLHRRLTLYANQILLECNLPLERKPTELKNKPSLDATREGKKFRLRILKEYMDKQGIEGKDKLAQGLGVSKTALYGMCGLDTKRYSKATLTRVLKKLGCSIPEWNRHTNSRRPSGRK